jgi:hypothetical protein
MSKALGSEVKIKLAKMQLELLDERLKDIALDDTSPYARYINARRELWLKVLKEEEDRKNGEAA